jgi:hypothetical protein
MERKCDEKKKNFDRLFYFAFGKRFDDFHFFRAKR